jgi:hypothetical protein
MKNIVIMKKTKKIAAKIYWPEENISIIFNKNS